MSNLDDIVANIQERLDEKDTVREIAIKSSRATTRLASGVVHGIHKKEDVENLMAETMDESQRLKSLLDEHPDIWHSGIVQDALQEVAEAAIVLNITKGLDLPEPDELDIPVTSYLMGFADAIGELRRFALEALREGRNDDAVRFLVMMEEMFLILMKFDYPDAIVSIRRKQDIARSVLEKTRGEVAVAVSMRRLETKLASLDKKL